MRTPDRATIERYLAENDLPYQRVELPHGLSTKGADRSGTMRLAFPERLDGESVLDIGSYLGAFCHEAKRRGAARVVGADVDPVRLRHAKQLAEFAGHEIEFRPFDVDRDELGETFDHVLFLNVLHHSKRPVETLERVSRLARKRLVIELPSTSEAPMDQLLRTRWKASEEVRAALAGLPVIGVAPNLFYFNPEAVRNLLLDHGRLYARVDVTPSPTPGRYVAVAWRRRIGELLVVAGPSGVGKTRMLDDIEKGAHPAAAKALSFGDGGWTRVQNAKIRELDRPDVPRLLVHYDILRSHFGGARTYARDQALDVIECAARTRIVTLFARRDVLLSRFAQHRAAAEGRRARRAERVAAFYGRPHYLRDLYERWAAFCDRPGIEHLYVDAGDPACPVFPASALPRVLAAVSG